MAAAAALSLEQIDSLLEGWDDWLRRVDENLLALEGDATYQMLSGPRGARASLEGATRDRVAPALEAVARLFDDRERLRQVLDRARALRASLSSALSFFGRDEKLAEITNLLKGPSIVLGVEATPLSRRSLLDAGPREVATEPETLLARMASTYELARDALTAVARAWRELEPTLVRLEREVAQARDEARGSLDDAPDAKAELDALGAQLTEIHERVARDPLGAGDQLFAQLGPKIERVRARAEAARRAREQAQAALADADELRARLAEAHQTASKAIEELLREIEVGPAASQLATPQSLLDDLDGWLARLRQAADEGHAQAASVGLGRWGASARQYLERDLSARERAERLLARRTELIGRLSARRAQAQALAARGARLAGGAEAFADEAASLLAQTPTPVGRAAAAVDAYEQAVVAASRRGSS